MSGHDKLGSQPAHVADDGLKREIVAFRVEELDGVPSIEQGTADHEQTEWDLMAHAEV